MSIVDSQIVAHMFGMSEGELSEETVELIRESRLSYRDASETERDAIILRVLHRIFDEPAQASGEDRLAVWEKGWGENFEQFVASGGQREALVPRYFKPFDPMRWFGKYVFPEDPRFELKLIRIMRSVVAQRFLQGFEHIYEFGCGTGYHLIDLCRWCSDARVVGLDWVSVTPRLMGEIAKKYDLTLSGRVFDYFNPDPSLVLEENAVVLTFASLEQVGERVEPFLETMLRLRPKRCVHVECAYEMYDSDNLLDFLALKYHRVRNYLRNFIPSLEQLERDKRIRIIEKRRFGVGNWAHEAYTLIVWEPA